MSTTVEVTDYERKWTATPSFKLPECPAYEPWLPVLERLRLAAGFNSHKVLTIAIVVDRDGKPIHWTKPRVTLLEPKGLAGDAFERLIAALTRQEGE